MSTLTALLGLVKAANTEQYDVNVVNANLDLIDSILGGHRAPWTDYVPQFTAVTTNPTLGTGGGTAGSFIAIGKTVLWHATVTFGTAGVAIGSGVYSLSLPVPAANLGTFCGVAAITDSGTGMFLALASATVATDKVDFTSNGSNSRWTHAGNPMIPAINDKVVIMGLYEAA